MKSKPIITIPFLKLAYLIGRKKIKPLTHTVSLGKMSEEEFEKYNLIVNEIKNKL